MLHDALPEDGVVALRFDETAIAEDLARWCGGSVERVESPDDSSVVHTTIWVPTAKGPLPALPGYWIVRRGDDDYEPQSPEDFVARHEPIV